MLKPVLIYHGGCPDGFGAALAFWKKFGDDIEYISRYHSAEKFFGIDKSRLIGREIYMADIAFPREDLQFLMKYAKKIVVIDHHKSAEKSSGDLECCNFDMEHSGAVLAWKFLYPNEEVPMLLRYVEDRDLWKFELPYSEEILAALDSYERTFESWDLLLERLNEPEEVAGLLKEGKAILRYNKVLMKRIISSAYTARIKGYEVPIVNTPFFRSEILSQLAKEQPFAAGYHYDGESFIFSLRANGDYPGRVDVSEIATQFPGGGGHENASGFSIKELRDLDR